MIETRARLGGLGAWLTIYQGLLVLVPTNPSRKIFGMSELRCADRSVTWIRQPLFPPWLNRAIDVRPESQDESIRIRLGFAARKQLRETLTAAGFDIVDKTSWSLFFGP